MKNILLLILLLVSSIGIAQIAPKDSIKNLDEVIVKGYKTLNGIGHFLDEKDGIIYAGKKTEVIVIDSLDANKAINNTRQILGRIPGLNIVETESSGFTANGIATRGLNPIQSIEMNTRQNGYNVSADTYGYNEAYYLPSMESVSRIEMIRGAASLQFGSQFGGMVNYVLDDAPLNKPFEFKTSQTIGSFGLYNSFNSVGGNYKKWSYYSYIQYRKLDGYRPNSEQWQFSGFGRMQYNASDKLKFGVEYSILRNKLKMPGGLTDEQFQNDPQQSTRARNWLKTPWNIVTAYANYTPSENTKISLKTSYLFSSRSLVWRNEDGGPEADDAIDPATNQYVPREVGIEKMNNVTTELRVSQVYTLGNQKSTVAGGLRHSYAWFKRLGGGEGTTNSDFDLSINGDWGYNFDFTTTNIAPFVENIFRINDKFTITPGVRFEYLNTTALGYKIEENDKLNTDQSRNRSFALFGAGAEYKPTRNTAFYANISQSYRPISYAELEPLGVSSFVDPNLKDAKGYNSDFGYKGTIKNYLNFDFSGFYMAYNNRIGVVLRTDPTTNEDYTVRTNIANSVHKGVESYIEFNILKYLNEDSKFGLSIFNSYSYIDAKYESGEFKGKRVEAAAKNINRVGIIFNSKRLSSTFQVNYVGDAFGDASNAIKSDDPIAGYLPSYTVLDFSGNYKINNFLIKFGVNNIADKAYFTRRTDEYPGPGIIPATGRSFYLGFSAHFN